MTKIKADLKFNSECVLTVKDITGFQSESNPDGFILAGEGLKLTDGYFINVVLYNRYYGQPVVTNPKEVISKILNVNPDYASNFQDKHYLLNKDGVYTIKRIFIITKAYYDANESSGIFVGKQVMYYNEDDYKFYRMSSAGPVQICFNEFALEFSSITFGAVTSYKFVSTCNLNRCNFLLQKQFIETKGACDVNTTIARERDLIFMTLMVVKYLKDAGNLTDVQKLIESVDVCGLACRKASINTDNDCGCG